MKRDCDCGYTIIVGSGFTRDISYTCCCSFATFSSWREIKDQFWGKYLLTNNDYLLLHIIAYYDEQHKSQEEEQRISVGI